MSTEDGGGPGNTAPAGNNGLKDQVFALHWVKAHISNFGGDPNDVTLIGHGAGGASVHYHYLSQRSEGLFKRKQQSHASPITYLQLVNVHT